MSKVIEIKEETKQLMQNIESGADIFDRNEAKAIRELQKTQATWVIITSAANEYPGECRQPYFGAILSEQGRKALTRAKEAHE